MILIFNIISDEFFTFGTIGDDYNDVYSEVNMVELNDLWEKSNCLKRFRPKTKDEILRENEKFLDEIWDEVDKVNIDGNCYLLKINKK